MTILAALACHQNRSFLEVPAVNYMVNASRQSTQVIYNQQHDAAIVHAQTNGYADTHPP